MTDIKLIRKAIDNIYGDGDKYSDGDLLMMWETMTPSTQKKYLDSVKTETIGKPKQEKPNAHRDKAKHDV